MTNDKQPRKKSSVRRCHTLNCQPCTGGSTAIRMVSDALAVRSYDNAPMVSFFATLKAELISRTTYSTRAAARQAILAYIEGFYNATRRHSALGYRGPRDFERAIAAA